MQKLHYLKNRQISNDITDELDSQKRMIYIRKFNIKKHLKKKQVSSQKF